MGELFLLIRERGGPPRSFALPEGVATVGRTKQNQLVVTGANVSREHCRFVRKGDSVTLTNVAKNGTLRNGHRVVATVTLNPGDRIQVGDVELVFAPPSEAGTKSGLAAINDPEANKETPAAGTPSVPDPVSPSERSESRGEPAPPKKELPATVTSPSIEKVTEISESKGELSEPARRAPPRRIAERTKGSRAVALAITVIVVSGALGAGYALLDVKKKRDQDDADEIARVMSDRARSAADRARGPAAVSLDAPRENDPWNEIALARPSELPAALTSFARSYPEDPRADLAMTLAKEMRAINERGEERGRERGEALVAERLLDAAERLAAQSPGRARIVLDLAASVTSISTTQRIRALEKEARSELDGLRTRARETADKDGPLRALVLVLDERERLRGLGVDDEVLALASDFEEKAAAAKGDERSVRRRMDKSGANLREPLELTLKLDFATAREKWKALLMSGLTVQERLRVEWDATWCAGLERLYDELVKAANGAKKPEFTMLGAVRGKMVKADAKGFKIEARIGSGEAEVEWPWKRLEPGQVLELFEPIAAREESAVLAIAYYAFATGHDERAHDHLLKIIERRPDAKARVSSFLAVQTGQQVPEGGYVVFEGRLTSPVERDQIIAGRKKAKEEAAAAAKELAVNREKPKALKYLSRALGLMDEGYYEDGRSILAALASKYRDMPGVGDVAKARLDAPYLRRISIAKSGPSSNRLDLYVLAEGFLGVDEHQRTFDRYTHNVRYFLDHQDFFNAYGTYMNYWGINVASKEEGLSKVRENVKLDTAFKGSVAPDGMFTVDAGRVFACLDAAAPGEHDRLAFVVGNGQAPLASGGGGISSLPKTFLQAAAHECGHAFAGLGDEYDMDPSPSAKAQGFERPTDHVAARPVSPNVVGGSDESEVRAAAPWQHWLKLGDQNWTGLPLDIFEGAAHKRFLFWRPQRTCVMRDLGSRFCPVCMEQMVLRLYRFVRPIDRTWPIEKTVKHAKGKPLDVRAAILAPRTHSLEATWRVETGTGTIEDGPSSSEGTRAKDSKDSKDTKASSHTLKSKRIEDGPTEIESVTVPGKYLERNMTVVLDVRDPTPWVVRDDEGLLKQTFRWKIEVE